MHGRKGCQLQVLVEEGPESINFINPLCWHGIKEESGGGGGGGGGGG